MWIILNHTLIHLVCIILMFINVLKRTCVHKKYILKRKYEIGSKNCNFFGENFEIYQFPIFKRLVVLLLTPNVSESLLRMGVVNDVCAWAEVVLVVEVNFKKMFFLVLKLFFLNKIFFNTNSALRVPPAETRLTVYRRLPYSWWSQSECLHCHCGDMDKWFVIIRGSAFFIDIFRRIVYVVQEQTFDMTHLWARFGPF